MKKKISSLTVLIFILISSFSLTIFAADNVTATPTSSVVMINGGEISFDSYNINGSNYFKLRDLAYALNDTANQFGVGWNEEKNSIFLTRGDEYEPDGSEMQSKGVGKRSAVPTTSRIYMDGEILNLTAYNIGGNNYFKLRDMGKSLDFKVSWDAENNTIIINTNKGYYPEADEFDSAFLNTSADGENDVTIKGVTMVFNGALEELNPEDFTDIVFSRNYKKINNKLSYVEYKQVEKDDETQTYFYFSFANELKNYGVYKLKANYNGISFETAEIDIKEPPKPNPEDFNFSYFDVVRNDSVTCDIPNIAVRFTGQWNYINIEDFTNIVFMRDGIPVSNKLTYSGNFVFRSWEGSDDVTTDFYFEFKDANTTPGIYTLTANYRGVPFKVPGHIIDKYPIGDAQANPDDLNYISWVGMGDSFGMYSLTEISFSFTGFQEAFYVSDLTDLKFTLNGEEVEFELHDYITRYRYYDEYGIRDKTITNFHAFFVKPLTEPGLYEMTGNYMGKPFVSDKINVSVR